MYIVLHTHQLHTELLRFVSANFLTLRVESPDVEPLGDVPNTDKHTRQLADIRGTSYLIIVVRSPGLLWSWQTLCSNPILWPPSNVFLNLCVRTLQYRLRQRKRPAQTSNHVAPFGTLGHQTFAMRRHRPQKDTKDCRAITRRSITNVYNRQPSHNCICLPHHSTTLLHIQWRFFLLFAFARLPPEIELAVHIFQLLNFTMFATTRMAFATLCHVNYLQSNTCTNTRTKNTRSYARVTIGKPKALATPETCRDFNMKRYKYSHDVLARRNISSSSNRAAPPALGNWLIMAIWAWALLNTATFFMPRRRATGALCIQIVVYRSLPLSSLL